MQRRGWIIGGSIVLGIVLACAIVPLGIVGVLAVAGRGESGPQPQTRWQEQIVSGSGADRVALIEVSGVIGAPDETALFSSQLTHEQLLSQIRQARSDPRVKAVVLRVDSPGGGVVASQELHTALMQLRDAGKRLVVSMGSTAASGGYYISTAGERIYAHPDTLTGSLGVIISTFNAQELFDRIGVQPLVFKSGEFKDIASQTRPPTAEETAILQGIVDQAYGGFVDVIVAGRKLERADVERIADGRVYTGQQALELKLIDALGDREAAIAAAQELAGLQDALVVRYTASDSLRALLLGNLEQLRRPADPLGVRALLQPQAPLLEYRMP